MRSDPGARGASRGVTCIHGLRPVFLRLGVGLVGLEERGRGRHAGSGGRDDEDRRASVTARARMRPRSAPGLDVFAKAHCPPPVGNPAPGEKHAQKRPRRGTCPSVRSWAENRFPGTCIGAWGAGHCLHRGARAPAVGGTPGRHPAPCLLHGSLGSSPGAQFSRFPPSRGEPSPCPFCPGCWDARRPAAPAALTLLRHELLGQRAAPSGFVAFPPVWLSSPRTPGLNR